MPQSCQRENGSRTKKIKSFKIIVFGQWIYYDDFTTIKSYFLPLSTIEVDCMKVWLDLSFIVTFEVGGSIDCSRKPGVEGES